jgi:hypothetical protein
MERGDVPTAWIDQWVRARIKTRRGGGEYLVLAELADINDERIRLFNSKALATKAGNSEIARATLGPR